MSISQSGEIAGEAFHKWRSDSDRLEGIELGYAAAWLAAYSPRNQTPAAFAYAD